MRCLLERENVLRVDGCSTGGSVVPDSRVAHPAIRSSLACYCLPHCLPCGR